jgi:hypothetical protein
VIPSTAQVIAALIGAWRLFRFDRTGLLALDRSIEGFWRSFFCAALVAPLYAAMIWLRMDATAPASPLPRILAVHTIAYVVNWVAFPLAMFHLSQILERPQNYVGYIVAYNWCWAPQVVLMLIIAVFRGLGLFPPMFQEGLDLGAMLYGWAVLWFLAHTVLGVSRGTAVLIVVIDLLISYVNLMIALSMLKTA